MHEKIVDIIVWTIDQLQGSNNFEDITVEQLIDKGFTAKDISIAFSWVADLFENKKPTELLFSMIAPRESFRIFRAEEKSFFTEEAFNTITKLLAVGIIRASHVEIIMERAEYIGLKKINNDMVQQFVAYYMFDIPTPDEASIRYSLCGNESIN